MSNPVAKEKEKRRQLLAISIVVIIALLGINAYLLSVKSSQGDVIEKQEMQLGMADSLQIELNREYNAALEELELKKGENEELNNIIEDQKAELKKLKMKIERSIKNGNSTKASLEDARRQIQQLIAQRDRYVSEVDSLVGRTRALETEKEALTQEKTTLQSEIAKEKEISATIESEKQRVEAEKEQLSKKVNRGAVLNVREMAVQSLIVKKNGEEKETKAAKRTDRLRVCFSVIENPLTPSGNNKFLLRLITPIGETIALDAKGSGTFSNQTEGGSETRFTTSQEFEYDTGVPTNLCIDWDQDIQLNKGEYTAEVYNKGYLVGTKKFVLK